MPSDEIVGERKRAKESEREHSTVEDDEVPRVAPAVAQGQDG